MDTYLGLSIIVCKIYQFYGFRADNRLNRFSFALFYYESMQDRRNKTDKRTNGQTITTLCFKKHPRHFRLLLQQKLSYSNNFWCEYF